MQLKKQNISATTVFYMVCCILAIMKFVLVSNEEIIARFQPLDDLWHILAAARGYWAGGNYSNISFVHLPIYSLWVGLVFTTGIPLRIATELLFLVSGFLFVLSLSRAGINRFLCTVAYGLIIFHPVSFQLFDLVLTETLYAPLLLLALAAMIMMWINRGQKACLTYAIVLGIFSSLLWSLRKENVLILGQFILLAFIVFTLFRKSGHHWRCILQQITIMIVVPFVVICIVSLTIQLFNYNKFGLFVTTEMSAPGYCAAYKALLRIKPQHSKRFIPVTKDVRRAAYAVSPAFKELEPYFEGEFGYAAASTTRIDMKIQGEIAAGWFYWSLREAAALAGHHTSAREADAYYQRIANEINAAIDAGRLPGRPVFTTFLDPEVSNYLPYLPESFLKMWHLIISTNQPPHKKDDVDINPTISNAFDVVANRRTALTGYDVVILHGWAFHDSEPIKQIILRDPEGKPFSITEQFSPRPDVAKSYTANGVPNLPVDTGFTLKTTTGRQLSDCSLVIITSKDREFVIPYKQVLVGKPLSIVDPNTRLKVTFALDTVDQPQGSGKIQKSIQSLIWSVYGRFVTYMTYLSGIAVLILVLLRKKINLAENIYAILLILFMVVISRVALFALIDASSWPGNQARYLFPVMPVYSCFLVLIIYQTARVVKIAFRQKSNSDTTQIEV